MHDTITQEHEEIPRVFHFVFGLKKQREQFHLLFYLCLKSCIEVNRPDRLYFYYHYLPYGRYWDLIRPHLTLVHVPLVHNLDSRYGSFRENRRYSYAHHADFIRVEKVLEQGGVYADMDTLFVNPIPDHLYRKSAVIGRENDVYCFKRKATRPSLCNAFFMGRKGAPFLQEWLRLMPAYFDGTWSNHSCYLPYEISTKHPEWVHVEGQSTFYKYMWTREGLRDLFEGMITSNDDVCSIHLWNHLWWSKRRRDFSDFHGGLVNEARIRRVDTTFNVLARPFLPARPARLDRKAVWYRARDVAGYAGYLARLPVRAAELTMAVMGRLRR